MPVMLFNVILNGVKYSKQDYIALVLITIGMPCVDNSGGTVLLFHDWSRVQLRGASRSRLPLPSWLVSCSCARRGVECSPPEVVGVSACLVRRGCVLSQAGA